MKTINMNIESEKLKGVTVTTLKIAIAFLFIAWNINAIGQNTNEDKISIINANTYVMNGEELNQKELFVQMKEKNNSIINMHIKKAKIAKGGKSIGFMAIPTLALGTLFLAPIYADALPGITGAIPMFALENVSSYDNQTNTAIGGALLASGIACLTTSIVIGSNQKKHTKKAIEFYNQE